VIPGARNPSQARANAAVASRPPLPSALSKEIEAIYAREIAQYVEERW